MNSQAATLVFPLRSAQIVVLAVVALLLWSLSWKLLWSTWEVVVEVLGVVPVSHNVETWRATDDGATSVARHTKMSP